MIRRIASVVLVAVSAGLAGPKTTPVGHASNDSVEIEAKLYVDREAIAQILGSDLGGYYIVVDVKLSPRSKIPIWRDDFLLRTDRDGERSKPFQASQIAGKGSLIVSGTGQGAVMGQQRGPVWGGIGNSRPSLGPADGGGMGNTAAVIANKASVDEHKKADPVYDALNSKIFPEKETADPLSGLLYFVMEPKQKVKDLELIYTSPKGKLSIRFR